MVKICSIEKTGHVYYGTSMMQYESVDNCGTCNGTKCAICKDKYIVENFALDESEKALEEILYSGYDKKKAEEFYGKELD